MEAKYAVRAATPADVDSIVDVVLVAMAHDPQWDWRFVYKREFPEDHYKFTRLLYEEFISPANDNWHVMLAEAKSPDDSSKIVGFAVWDVSFANKAKMGPSYEPQNPTATVARAGGSKRRDVAPQRQAAFRAAGSEKKHRFFDEYGDRQLHLKILGVHPDHWRRGIGSELVRWGMNWAFEEGIPVTLVAGSQGLHLYSKLGFKNLGEYVTQVPGEEESVKSYGMVYRSQASEEVQV